MTDWKEIQQLLEEQKIEETLAALEQIPEEQRDTIEFYNIMGMLHIYAGNLDQAAEFLLLAQEKAPEDSDILYNLTYVAMARNDIPSFRACFDKLYAMELSEETYHQLDAWKKQLYGAREKKRVLMIAYYFPPLSGSGVFRSLKYAKYLREYGWEPTVISASAPPNGWSFKDDSQMDEIPEDMTVIRIEDKFSTGQLKSVEYRPICEYQLSVFRHDKLLHKMYVDEIKKGQDACIAMLQFPHHDLLWTYDVSEYIRKNIDMKQFDVIYTTSGPYSAHVLGCYLQEKYQIPWVADYRDEWTGNPYASFDKTATNYKMLFALENLLLHRADKNITTADTLCRVYEQNFRLDAHRMESITNGYDEQDFIHLDQPTSKNQKFTMVYSGLLYGKERTIEPFVQATVELIHEGKMDRSQVSINCVGSSDKDLTELANRYQMNDILFASGYISHKEALQYNVNGDLLLMMMGDELKYQHYYSGKIFDYIRSGKQILALAPPEGVIKDLFFKIGYGLLTQSTNLKQIKEYILQEYQKWQSDTSPVTYKYEGQTRFERGHLTGCMADILGDVVEDALSKREDCPSEANSDVYDQIYRTGGAGQAFHKHYSQSFYYPCWQQAMRYFYLLDRNAKILEVGCGAGQFANMLFDAGFCNYHGLDYAEEAIKLARNANIKHQHLFFVADAFQDPILEEQHDLVIFFEILEHIQDDIKLLSRLPDGTKVLLSVPNFMDPTHVRCFATAQDVKNRYKEILCIQDIQQVQIGQTSNILFYLLGEIKHRNAEASMQPTTCAQLKPYQESILESDKSFKQLVNVVKQASSLQLEELMVTNFKKQSDNFRNFVDKVTHGYPIRGVVDAATGKGSMVTDRIQCLKEHIADFEWLYNRLADHRSRAVLYSILAHWLTYEPGLIKRVQESLFADYFDLDIMPLEENEVIVDLGMYTGDTVLAYQNVCKPYKKWYCYEVDERNIPIAMENLKGLPNIDIRCKAVCDKNGYVYMNMHADSSSNIVGKGDVKVPAVTLDEDIKEPITLIKMDIEGSEQSALRGCMNHIRNEKPKLAICTYHGNYDIWQIPRLIDSIRDDYKFYMRYNGTDLAIPREYVLIAI